MVLPTMPRRATTRGAHGRSPRGGLAQALDTPTGKAGYVRALFDEIAPRYDEITVWLSLGRDAGLLVAAGFAHHVTVLVDLFPQTPHVEAVSTFVRGA